MVQKFVFVVFSAIEVCKLNILYFFNYIFYTMKRILLVVALAALCWLPAMAQQNIALQAVAAHSGGGTTTFDASNYNDGVISVGTAQPWGWVTAGGWIEYTWSTPKSFQTIVFYDGGRQVTAGQIQYWDALTSSYVTVIANFGPLLDPTPGSADTVVLPTRVTSTKLRFNALAGSNPNHREIEVYEAPSGRHDAGATAISGLVAVCPSSVPIDVTIQNFGINIIDSVLVNWEVNGILQTPKMHNTVLDTFGGMGPSSAQVSVGNYSFLTNTNYVVRAWTSLPNNTGDTTNFNDTTRSVLRLGAPSGLAVGGVTATAATAVWNGAPSTSYEIIYGPGGFNPMFTGNSVLSSGASAPMTPLLANTLYDVYLVAECGGSSYSDTTGPVSFYTPCLTYIAPFFEDFDSTSYGWVASGSNAGNGINQCWTSFPPVSDGVEPFKWIPRNTGPTSGNGPLMDKTGGNFMYVEASGSAVSDTALLTTPPIDVSGLTTPALYFYQHRYSGATIADMEVQVTNDGSLTWSTVYSVSGDIQTSSSDPWQLEYVNLAAYTGDTIQIRFRQKGNGCCGDAAIDDVIVDEAPTCPWPGGLTITSITDSNAIAAWSDPSGNKWDLSWGPSGFQQGSPGTFNMTTSTNPDTLDGLLPNTLYDYYVRANCTDSANGVSLLIGPFTFRTPCLPFTAPYSDNFDSSPNNAVPFCWSNYITGGRTTNGVAQTYQFGTPISSPNHIRFYNGNPAGPGDTTLLISPQFSDMPVGDKRIQFYAQTTSTLGDDLVIGTMANPLDVLSFNPIDTVQLTTLYNLHVVELDLASGYNGTDQYIAFRHGNRATFRTIYIDDFLYEAIPSCNPPFANTLGVAGVSPATATFYWGAGTDGDETHWEVGPVGFTPGTNNHVASDSVSGSIDTVVVGGLTPQTTYCFYVRDSCAMDSYSPWVGPFCFTTACNILSAPFAENFDGTTWLASGNNAGNGLDVCWTSSPDVTSSTVFKWIPRSTGPTSGNGPLSDKTGLNYLYCEASGSVNTDVAYLYSPIVDVSSLAFPAIYFSQHRYSNATIADMEVEVTNNFGVTWSNVYSITGDIQTAAADPWVDEIIALGGYVGDTIQVRFIQKGNGCCGDAAIDDFRIAEAPTCPIISGLDTIQVTDTSAVITWGPSPNAAQYQIWYGPQGFFQGTASTGATKVLSTTNTLTLQQLQSQFCYEYLVRSYCGPGDTSAWAGPFVFCTDLGYDAELLDIGKPDGCGSTASQITAIIRNNGDNPIGGFPINVSLLGTHNNTFNTVYTGPLASGATDTVIMGTINTLNGAIVTYTGYVNLPKDQISINDSLRYDSIITIPLDPVAYDTTFCTNQDTAVLLAYPVPGVTYNWFANATDTVPLYTGNPFSIPMGSTQPTYYVEYGGGAAGSLTTSFVGGNGQSGNAFDLLPLSTISITGIDIHVSTTAAQSVNIYYRTGSYVGFNTALTGWTLHETVAVTGGGTGVATPVPFTNPLQLNGNQLYSMMVVLTTSTSIAYTNGSTTGAVLAQNSDLIIYEGAGISWPLGSNFNPRYWNGTIYYGGKSCSTVRKSVNLTIGSDTAVAAFSATAGTGMTMNFDATATVNGDHYAWDFGDGSSGTGITTSHSYATNGNYTVTLTVSDSTDCYSTSVADTSFLMNISLDENALERSMVIYPNPAHDEVKVSFDPLGSSKMDLRITDLSGKEVISQKVDNLNGKVDFIVNIGKLADGVYMIEVSNGELKAIRRLVKQ